MVPSAFVVLDAMPMTPNGKVDRRALPDPGHAGAAPHGPAIAPRDEVEARLARVWEEVLDVRPVGVNQSFFDLGGHSLLAIRLLGRIDEEFGRRLPLAALFRGPTVEELAHVLRAEATRTAGGPWSPVVAIRAEGEKPPFFCVHPAGGIVYCFQDLARQLGGDRPFYALQAAGLEGDVPPFEVFEAMAARYVEAVRAEQPEGPYHLGGWSLGGVIAFEMARQLREGGHEVATVALFDSWAPTALPRTAWPRPKRRSLARPPRSASSVTPTTRGRPARRAGVRARPSSPADLVREFGGDARRLIGHLEGTSRSTSGVRYLLKAFQLDLVYHLETGPEQVERLWSVLRANLLAGVRYRPGPYPGRVAVFRARDAQATRVDRPERSAGSV